MIRTVTVKYHRVPLQLGYNNRELAMLLSTGSDVQHRHAFYARKFDRFTTSRCAKLDRSFILKTDYNVLTQDQWLGSFRSSASAVLQLHKKILTFGVRLMRIDSMAF